MHRQGTEDKAEPLNIGRNPPEEAIASIENMLIEDRLMTSIVSSD